MARLKASRDKLLEQIDKQWEELDRLGAESKAASDELACTRRLAANWEAQAQDSLAHVERLKVGRRRPGSGQEGRERWQGGGLCGPFERGRDTGHWIERWDNGEAFVG